MLAALLFFVSLSVFSFFLHILGRAVEELKIHGLIPSLVQLPGNHS